MKWISMMLYLFLIVSVEAQEEWKYEQKINEAENFVVKGLFDESLKSYLESFTINNKPFGKDIDNALNCAVEIENYPVATQLVKQLIRLGCNLEFFRKQASLNKFLKSKKWFQIVEEYPQLRNEYLKKCDLILRSKIEELFARDQYWRNKDPQYSVLKDSTFKEDDKIMIELNGIMKNTYPNEYDIGLFFYQDTLIGESPIQIILLHNYTANDKYKIGKDITESLVKAVKDRKLSNDAFAYLNDRSGKYMLAKGFGREGIVWKLKNKFFIEKRTPEITAEINNLRKKYGLEPLESALDKALYQIRIDKRFDFFHESYILSIDLPEQMIKTFFVEVK